MPVTLTRWPKVPLRRKLQKAVDVLGQSFKAIRPRQLFNDQAIFIGHEQVDAEQLPLVVEQRGTDTANFFTVLSTRSWAVATGNCLAKAV